jgi:lipopolysaccharide/colanic/teichoic acid biosynthesis glycosyltransferase
MPETLAKPARQPPAEVVDRRVRRPPGGAGRPWRRRSPRSRRLLLVGATGPAQQLVTALARRPGSGPRIVGYLDGSGRVLHGARRLGAIDDLQLVLCHHRIDEILICPPLMGLDAVKQVVQAGWGRRTVVRILVDPEPYVDAGDNLPRRVAIAAKRSLDLVGGLLLLLLCAPILLTAAAAIMAVDGRPVLFLQARGGLHGRVFKTLKLRTMVTDAEARRAALLGRNERVGPAFKLSDDPRITRLGRLLRRTSIDELPQLLNVIRGDMSLVGPRPLPLTEILACHSRHHRRLRVKSGMTGLWQVSARREPDFERWIALDLQYIDEWSLLTDVVLLLRTPLALIRFPGQ